MLNRSKLTNLTTYLRGILQKQPDLAYSEAYIFLDSIIAEYYCVNNEILSKEIDDLHNARTSHWNSYHKLQHKLIILAKLYEKNKAGVVRAINKVYETSSSKYESVVAAHVTQSIAVNPHIDFEEFSFHISKVFANGITEGLLSNYEPGGAVLQQAAEDMSASVATTVCYALDDARSGNFSGFVTRALGLIHLFEIDIVAEELNAKPDQIAVSASERKIKNLKTIKKTFNIAVNEAITLVNHQKKYTASQSLTDEIEKICQSVEESFGKYLIKNLALLISSIDINNAPDIGNLDNDNFYINVYDALSKIITILRNAKNPDNKRLADALRLKKDLLQFFQPGVVPAHFGVLNPYFVLDPNKLAVNNNRYERFKNHLKQNLKINIGVLQEDVNAMPSQNSSIFTYISDSWHGYTESNPESGSGTDTLQRTVNNYLENFKGILNAPEAIDQSYVTNLTRLTYALNQSVYNDRYVPILKKARTNLSRWIDQEGVQQKFPQLYSEKKDLVVEGGHFLSDRSRMRMVIEGNLARLRGAVNARADEFKVLLVNSSEITAYDLYFELNLPINIGIKEEVEKNYAKVNGFPRTLLNIFGNAHLDEKRIAPLKELMDKLITCKTEEDYIKFLISANELLVKCRGNEKVRWDSLFKESIIKAINMVIANHVLKYHDKFGLNFTTEQLELMVKILRANRMDQSKNYEKLSVIIEKKKKNEASIPSELKIKELNADLTKSASEPQLNVDQRKVDKFRTLLIQKMESNILADMVISTDRFQLKDRDIGIIVQKFSYLLANVNSQVVTFIANQAHEYDTSRQVADGTKIAETVAQYGGYQMMFNEIVSAAVNELCAMFDYHIRQMDNEEEAARFAEFCFNRMYAVLKMSPAELQKINCHTLSLKDVLIASVFNVRKSLTWVPFRKDHYRCSGDRSRFPETTFQGLVNNVAFYVQEEVEQTHSSPSQSEPAGNAPQSAPVNVASISKEGVALDSAGVPVVEAINAQQGSSAQNEKRNDSSTRKIKSTLFIADKSIREKQSEEPKFSRYGVLPCPNAELATHLLRSRYDSKEHKLSGEKLTAPQQGMIEKVLTERKMKL